MKRQTHRAAILVTLLVLIAQVGCSGVKKVKITGNLMKDGQPMVIGKEYQVLINFNPIEIANQQTQRARFTYGTGAFEIEVLPGKYNIGYSIVVKDRSLGKDQPPEKASKEQLDKVYDLTQDQEVNIEVK